MADLLWPTFIQPVNFLTIFIMEKAVFQQDVQLVTIDWAQGIADDRICIGAVGDGCAIGGSVDSVKTEKQPLRIVDLVPRLKAQRDGFAVAVRTCDFALS